MTKQIEGGGNRCQDVDLFPCRRRRIRIPLVSAMGLLSFRVSGSQGLNFFLLCLPIRNSRACHNATTMHILWMLQRKDTQRQ